MRPRQVTQSAALVCLFVALTGCGESEQAKAEKTVCEAKTKISTSIQSLQHQTTQTVTISQVGSDLSAITASLGDIRQAQDKLSGPRKEQVQKATETFSNELTGLTHELTSLTLPQAKSQLSAAVNKLAESYKQALAPVQC